MFILGLTSFQIGFYSNRLGAKSPSYTLFNNRQVVILSNSWFNLTSWISWAKYKLNNSLDNRLFYKLFNWQSGEYKIFKWNSFNSYINSLTGSKAFNLFNKDLFNLKQHLSNPQNLLNWFSFKNLTNDDLQAINLRLTNNWTNLFYWTPINLQAINWQNSVFKGSLFYSLNVKVPIQLNIRKFNTFRNTNLPTIWINKNVIQRNNKFSKVKNLNIFKKSMDNHKFLTKKTFKRERNDKLTNNGAK